MAVDPAVLPPLPCPQFPADLLQQADGIAGRPLPTIAKRPAFRTFLNFGSLDRGYDLWQNFEDHVERLATHLPEVLLACLIALATSFAREASKLRRSKKRLGCLDFCFGCAVSGVLGGSGGLIAAAAATIPLKEFPWGIVAFGAAVGIAVDLTSATGVRFLLAMVIRTMSRLTGILAAEIEPFGDRQRHLEPPQESDSSSSSDSDGS